jgi:hypothetical protein
MIFGIINEVDKTLQIYYYANGGAPEMLNLNVSVFNDTDRKLGMPQPIGYTIDRLWSDPKVNGVDFSKLDMACCYYSSAFDSTLEVVYKNIVNISTNYKVEEFLKVHINLETETARKKEQDKQQNRKARTVPELKLWPSHIADFHTHELIRKIQFIAYADTRETGDLPPLPEQLFLRFNFYDWIALNEGRSEYVFTNAEKLDRIHKAALGQVTGTHHQRTNFYHLVILCSFYYCLRAGLLEVDPVSLEFNPGDFKRAIDQPETLFVYLESLLMRRRESRTKNSRIINRFLGKDFHNRLDRLNFVGGEEKNVDKTGFSIKIDQALLGVLRIIYDLPAFDNSSFLSYDWRGLSTGEDALLGQYSRFYEVKSRIKQRNILILIDEGDLYFHPQWQKEYLTRLLQFIPFIFPRKQIQFVITTHSPFIASDLPKQNLIFLEKGEDGSCIIADPLDQPETFGANIHELFTNSFFLANGLMGEFAREKIEQLITDVNEMQHISELQYERDFKKRINIIGEPFIKAKLLELVAQKSNGDLLDKIIADRATELDHLRQIRQTKRNDKNNS